MKDHKCLASYVIFKELYAKDHDIYDVVRQFAKESIIINNLHRFNIEEITTKINEEFSFDLPLSVVKTSLKKIDFLEKSYGMYNVISKAESNSKILKLKKTVTDETDSIIDQLICFIEEKQQSKLSDVQKLDVSNSFCNFLLFNTNGFKYSDYISTFIILNEKNKAFNNNLQSIKEGVVLYSGIKYTDPSLMGSWDTELTIYLDTEILFHLAGYNGPIFKRQVNTLLSYIKEINKRTEKIHLKYFQEVKDEVEGYFYIAEKIKQGTKSLKPGHTAMASILNGAKDKSDILTKKSDLYLLLKTNRIFQDDESDYFSEKNHKYNLIDSDKIEEIEKEKDFDDIRDNVRFLNYINILRKNSTVYRFEDARFILLTGTSTTLKISYEAKSFREENGIPLATDLDFLVNKFWFKMNKGFGKQDSPYTVDVVNKAKITLSAHLGDSINEEYEEVKNLFNQKKVSKETLHNRINDLRQKRKEPEILNEDNAEEVLVNITEDSLEKYLIQEEHFKQEAELNKDKNSKLQQSMSDLELKYIEATKSSISSKKILLEKLKVDFSKTLNDEKELRALANKRINRRKHILVFTIVMIYLISFLAIKRINWNSVEKYATLLSFSPHILSLIFIIIKERTPNIKKILSRKNENILRKIFKRNNFSNETKLKQEKEILFLEDEIRTLESEI